MKLFFLIKKLNRPYTWLLLILIFGGFFRLINIGAEPYWGDEVLSLDIVKHFSNSLPTLLQYLREVEIHPPLYYLLLHYWISIFGDSELAVRFLSFLFGLGTIIGVYALAKILFKKENVALMAAFITAILPIQIEYSQEARPYIIFCFLGILAMIGFWKFRETQKIHFAVLYCLASILGLYLHYSFFLFLASTSLYWILDIIIQKDKDKARSLFYWLGAHAIIFIGFLWWLDAFLFKIALSKYQIFGYDRNAIQFRLQFIYEQIFHQIIWMSKEKLASLTVIVATIISQISIIFFLVNALLRKPDFIIPVINQHKKQLFFLFFLLFSLIIFFIISPQSVTYSTIFYRHVILASIIIALLLAFIFSLLDKKSAGVVVAIFVISLIPFITLVIGNDEQWDYDFRLKDAANFINEKYEKGDLVLVYISTLRTDFNHFLRPDISAMALMPIGYTNQDIWASRQTLGLIENEYQLRADFNVTPVEFGEKLKYLDKKFAPKRMWVFADFYGDTLEWFRNNNWRHAFKAIRPIFPLDLFVRP